MDVNKLFTRKGVMFLLLFSVLVFFADKVNFSKLVGTNSQFFTLFQLFGPIAGAFLGPVVGVLSVLIAEVTSKMSTHAAFDLVTVLRLTPMLFAAWYFGTKKDKLSYLIPILAIIAFIAHPVGRQVWYFSLFWIIPILMKATSEKYSRYVVNGVLAAMVLIVLLTTPNALAIGAVVLGMVLYNIFPDISSKSLGATFTAHAVGGAIWNYFVPMTPSAWIALIPIVVFERLVFASGITVSFLAFNTVLDKLSEKVTNGYLNLDKRYVLFKQRA